MLARPLLSPSTFPCWPWVTGLSLNLCILQPINSSIPINYYLTFSQSICLIPKCLSCPNCQPKGGMLFSAYEKLKDRYILKYSPFLYFLNTLVLMQDATKGRSLCFYNIGIKLINFLYLHVSTWYPGSGKDFKNFWLCSYGRPVRLEKRPRAVPPESHYCGQWLSQQTGSFEQQPHWAIPSPKSCLSF